MIFHIKNLFIRVSMQKVCPFLQISERYKDMEASEGNFFKLEPCWDMLKECEKRKLIDKQSPSRRGALTNMDGDEDDDGPRNLNKPDGDKKTKEKIKREHEASSLRDNIDVM